MYGTTDCGQVVTGKRYHYSHGTQVCSISRTKYPQQKPFSSTTLPGPAAVYALLCISLDAGIVPYGESDDGVDDYEDESFQPMGAGIPNRIIDNNNRRKCYERFKSIKE